MNRQYLNDCGRTPHGVRGLKLERLTVSVVDQLSHPSRGAWIEIPVTSLARSANTGRTPHGVRGLKCLCMPYRCSARRRTPHGVRGLK